MSTTEIEEAPAVDVAPGVLPTAAIGRRRRGKQLGVWFAIGWLVLIVLAAMLADVLPIADPNAGIAAPRQIPFEHWPEFLGTDTLGRSELSRIIFGARISMVVGPIAAVCALVIGGLLGVIAGYSRRIFDPFVSLLSDSLLAFPALVFLIALAAVFEPSRSSMILGLTVISIPGFLRLARANAIRFADREFVTAARALGARPARVVFRELTPNVAPSLLAFLPLIMAVLISAEAALSYLGLGIPPPTASWGVMISDGQPELAYSPSVVLVPSIALFITVYSLNVVGEWLRTRMAASSRFL